MQSSNCEISIISYVTAKEVEVVLGTNHDKFLNKGFCFVFYQREKNICNERTGIKKCCSSFTRCLPVRDVIAHWILRALLFMSDFC